MISIAATLSLAWSCEKPEDPTPDTEKPEQEQPGGNENQGGAEISEIIAALENTTVKTAWAEGDAILVYAVVDGADVAAKYILADAATGKFVPSGKALPSGAGAYFATYPYNEDLTFAQHNTFAFSMEAEQAQETPVFAYAEDAANLTFSSPVGALKLSLKGRGGLAKIEVTDVNSKAILNGNVTYNPKTTKFDIKNSAASKNVVTKVLAEKVELGATAVDFVIEVPKTTLAEGANVVLYDVNNSPFCTIAVPAQTIEAGKVVVYEAEEIVPVVQTVNLNSNQGYANTYQIPAVGKYKFEPVKGNDSSAKLDAVTAEITWETWCNNETVTANSLVKEVKIEEGFVLIETADDFHAGNALVSVKDASGTIVWSWMLWFVEGKIGTVNLDGYEIMDRNLGALTNDPTKPGLNYGLLWQWGRSTPILGLDGTGALVQMTNAQGVEIKRLKLSDLQDDPNNAEQDKSLIVPELAGLDGFPVEYVIANPTKFFYSGNRQWAPNPHDEDAQYLWNPSAKTIYDPCPAGYQVITPDVAAVLFSGIADSVENDPVNKGFKLNDVYYPYTGWWKYSGSSYVSEGAHAYFWTSGTKLRDEQSGYNVSTHYQVTDGTGKTSYESKGDALTVRCERVAL